MTDNDHNNHIEMIKFEYDRLWNYFSYHASQRIKTFHMFLIISGLISSALAVIFAKAGIHAAKEKNAIASIGEDALSNIASNKMEYHAFACKPNAYSECYKLQLDQVKSALGEIKNQLISMTDATKCNIDHLPDLLTIMLVLGLLLMFFSWVFWMLDNRNHTLISIARNQLILMEKAETFKYPIFSKIEDDTQLHDPIRFKKCIGYIYFVVFVMGLIISVYSIKMM